MTPAAHIPVLPEEVLQYLDPKPGQVVCDGTLGAGGHSRLLLAAIGSAGRLIAFDRDPSVVELCSDVLADPRVVFCRTAFGGVAEALAERAINQVDGFLLDLGVSSMQLDRGERGFSFARPGPIDMRMDPTSGETALELIRGAHKDELTRILREYGDERFAPRIAAALKDASKSRSLETTADLAALVESVIPGKAKRQLRIHPATKTFQALRIAVNREIEELEQFLEAFPALLRTGGRCVIISFHSTEDRLVKRCFRDLAQTSSLPPDLARQAGERVDPICKVLTRKPIEPGETEVARNPRARSARLRACERVAA